MAQNGISACYVLTRGKWTSGAELTLHPLAGAHAVVEWLKERTCVGPSTRSQASEREDFLARSRGG